MTIYSFCELLSNSLYITYINVASNINHVLTANMGISASAALKELSDPKLILGSGHGHLLTRPYMEIRQEAFDDLHKDKVKYKLENNAAESNHL